MINFCFNVFGNFILTIKNNNGNYFYSINQISVILFLLFETTFGLRLRKQTKKSIKKVKKNHEKALTARGLLT